MLKLGGRLASGKVIFKQNLRGSHVLSLKKPTQTDNVKSKAPSSSKQSTKQQQLSFLVGKDIIGPPDPVSNIRPVTFHVPHDESPVEREFRLKRQDLQRWHQEFWSRQNAAFIREKSEFERDRVKPLNADELSVFYKNYLDKNWRVNLAYQWEWTRRNISCTVTAAKVKFMKLLNLK